MQDFYETEVDGVKYDEKQFKNLIINNIKCELHLGVQNTLAQLSGERDVEWIRDWGAVINLKITADEQSSISPGMSSTTIYPNGVAHFPSGNVSSGQSFVLGLGGSATAHTTRAETVAFTYSFKDLMQLPPIKQPCDHENGILIQSNLGISDFIYNNAWLTTVPGTVRAQIYDPKNKSDPGPYSVFSDELTFVATFSANITPTWRFLRVSANTSSNFFSSTRTKTHDLTITLGPTKPAEKGRPAQVSGLVADYNFAKIIGQEVASAIRRTAP